MARTEERGGAEEERRGTGPDEEGESPFQGDAW